MTLVGSRISALSVQRLASLALIPMHRVSSTAVHPSVDGIRWHLLALVLSFAVAPALDIHQLSAQEAEQVHVFEGNVRDAGTGEPLAGAHVSVVGRETWAVTRGDGSFHLTGLAAGAYILRADRLGYRGATAVVTVGTERARRAVAESAEVVIELAPSPIALEDLVVTATITERAAAEALRPVSVMAGDDLQ
ncbi:MAG: carboxypeptidase-like regulatory domain-containing protein, partial [Gemmatimonadetes bacterium]|nr:carboxypeptidase-like regulatory domain-containing protein [Gemmatimonadota bacterium]